MLFLTSLVIGWQSHVLLLIANYKLGILYTTVGSCIPQLRILHSLYTTVRIGLSTLVLSLKVTHTCVHACIHTCTAYTHRHACMHTYNNTHNACIHTYASIHIYIHYTYTHILTCIQIYACMYAYTYICMDTHTHRHADIHTHSLTVYPNSK